MTIVVVKKEMDILILTRAKLRPTKRKVEKPHDTTKAEVLAPIATMNRIRRRGESNLAKSKAVFSGRTLSLERPVGNLLQPTLVAQTLLLLLLLLQLQLSHALSKASLR
jgi:hypothetical protein